MLPSPDTTLLSLESEPRYPSIRFEPGNHTLLFQKLELIARYEKDDPSAHAWNKEVLERLSQYQPKILGIDGLPPSFGGRYELGHSPQSMERTIWLALPGRPREINGSATVIIVRGDLYNIADIVPYSLDEQSASSPLREELKRDDANFYLRDAASLTADTAVTSLGSFLALMALCVNPRIADMTRGMSRRQFLKLAGAAALSIPFLRFSPIGGAVATSEPLRNMWSTLAEIGKPRLFLSRYADFRTALLMSKIEDSIDQLGFSRSTPGAVLLGSIGHGARGQELLRDPDDRMHAIRSFSAEIANHLQKTAVKFNENPNDAVVRFLTMIKTADVIEVTDPPGPPFSRPLHELVAERTKPIASFSSSQVERALASM